MTTEIPGLKPTIKSDPIREAGAKKEGRSLPVTDCERRGASDQVAEYDKYWSTCKSARDKE